MRELWSSLAAVAVLLLVGCAGPAPPSQELGMPTAASIEGLVREKLAKDDFENSLQNPFKKPVLLNFGLVELDQVSPTQWHAEIELSLDFGPPPPSIVGFQQIRRGRYELMLKPQGKRWALFRFHLIGRVHPLPASS